MNISPADPIGPAWNRMVNILFRPFDFTKWLLLGFCAFLAHCGEGGGANVPTEIGDLFEEGGAFPGVSTMVVSWVQEHMALAVAGIFMVGMVVLALTVFVTWISSRGKFMFLDGVVRNRGAVQEPWAEYRAEGNSLTLFRLVVTLIILLGAALLIGLPLGIGLPMINSGDMDVEIVSVLVLAAVVILPFVLLLVCGLLFVEMLMVPTMYLRRVSALEGCKIAWSQLVSGQKGATIVLFLLTMMIGIMATILILCATCCTCCFAAIPYVSSVVFLPVPVFFTCYALEYIQQFGDAWQFFPAETGGE
jgi:hypothetical protein